MWKFFAWISSGDRIFHETLSMKAPNVLSEFAGRRVGRAGKSTARPALAALLSGFGIQMMVHDVVEHLPVHQDVEDGVVALLVDQRARS